MSYADLAKTIDDAFEARAEIRFDTKGPVREAVEEALRLLDTGEARVAEKIDGAWQVNQWLKKAVLLNFRLNDNHLIEGAPGGSHYWDKVATVNYEDLQSLSCSVLLVSPISSEQRMQNALCHGPPHDGHRGSNNYNLSS